MNVARRPWLRAISRTTDLKTTVSSQTVDRGAVAEVDLDLRRAVLGVGGLDDDAVGLDHAADVADDVLELGALLQRVALDAVVDRLAVLVGEIELDLGRQHGLEAARLAALDLAPQLVARVHVDRLVAVLAHAIGHAERRALAPRRRSQRRQVGHDDHVDDVRGRVVVRQLRQLAVPTPVERRVGLRKALLAGALEEERGRDALAAQVPLRVGERDLDRVDVVLRDDLLRVGVQLLCARHIWGMISECDGGQAQPPKVPGPTTQSTPASGTPVNAEASSESARRSSGSRLWTLPLPHDLARIVIS